MARAGLKQMTRTQEVKLGHFIVEFATPGIGHMLKQADCDFALFDLEHSGFGSEIVRSAVRYFEAAGPPAIVRGPSKEYHHIARVCDVGAAGIMIPMVGTAAEAEAVTNCMKYYPDGRRGVALGVAHDVYGQGPVPEKLAGANERTTLFCQIETAEAAENADEIATVDGVDCLWIDHFDLSVSLGVPGQFDHPKFLKAVERTIAAAKKHKRALGCLVPTTEVGIELYKQRFDFCCYSGDVWVLRDALAAAMTTLEGMHAMNASFRVALSGDFRKADGSPVYPNFDLKPLLEAPGVEMAYLGDANPLQSNDLEDFDALILLAHRFTPESAPKNGRLSIIARFGVGYDTVDVPTCTAADVALATTPDGVRRPVAVSIMTFILALTGKLIVKDKLTRQGPSGFAVRGEHMGVGLVGKTLGSVGIGNIGAELFRLAKPFDMGFIAHDPFADTNMAAALGVELVSLDDIFVHADIVTVNCPLTPETRHLVNADRLALMKKTAFFINTARGPIVDQKALTVALASGRIAGAALDVFEPGTDRSDRSPLRARQCHRNASRTLLDRSVFRGKWCSRHQGRARHSAWANPTRYCQSRCA